MDAPARTTLPLAAFFVLAAAIVDFSTDTPFLGPFYGLGPASQTTSALCAAALGLAALLALSPAWPVPPWPAAAVDRAMRALPIAPFLLAAFWSRQFVDPAAWGAAWNAFVVAAPLALAAAAGLRVRAVRVAAICAAAGVILRLVSFHRFSIDVGADMLPLVRSALESFVAGRSPYAIYQLPAPLPLTYYPLTWLAYLAPHLLRIDLRVTNLVAELSIPVALFVAGRARARTHGPAAARAADLALLLWSAYFLLPSSIFFDRITTAPIAWALIAWTVTAVALGSRADFALVGATCAATPLALVLLPAVALVWARRHGKRAFARAAGAAALAAAAILPFYAWAPRAFVDGAVLWFNDLDRFPRTKWDAFRTWRRYVGLSGLFWESGKETWLKPLQALAVVAVTALFARRRADPDRLAAHAAAAFVLFMIVNPVHWPYFYQPALVCGLCALAVSGVTATGSKASAPAAAPEAGGAPA